MSASGLLKRLDGRGFLGFDVWDFSARSLLRPYGRVFLGRVLLRHPWRFVAGLREYRRRSDPALAGTPSRESFEAELSKGDWVLGVGFCQKPMDPPCPSGRFNHDCVFLAQQKGAAPAPACGVCQIRELAERASPAGAQVYIMTSAADIARDLLLPALRGKGSRRGVLSVCPFSVAPLTLAMTICGVRGIVESYAEGACADFAMWARADEGDKQELTRLAPAAHQRLLDLLDRVAAGRRTYGSVPSLRIER